MIRFVGTGFLSALLSARTICPAIVVGAFGLFQLSRTSGHPDVNAWDVVIPTLTDTLVTSTIGLMWWFLWLAPAMTSVSREQILIRYGSRARAVRMNLATLTGSLAAWSVLLIVVCIAVASPLGLATVWSPSALAVGGDQPSAFSAAAHAPVFPNPLVATGASLAFTGIGYLAVAAVGLALAARGYQRTAVVSVVCFMLWAIVCSFSLVPIPPVLDASVALSLGWAMAVPGGVVQAVPYYLVTLVLASAVTRVLTARASIRALLTNRSGTLLALTCVAVVASVNTVVTGQGSVNPVQQFFAGAYGDTVSYVAVAAVPLGFVTGYLARLSEAAEGWLLYEALRRGSYRRWLGATLRRELVFAIILCLLTGATLLVTLVLTGHRVAFFGEDGAFLAVGLAGMFAVIALLAAIGTTLLWTGASAVSAWPITAGIALVVGYSVPANTGAINLAAPYSLPQDLATLTPPIIATTITLAAAVAVTVVALCRAVPSHSDRFA